jgi:hypothetical protein
MAMQTLVMPSLVIVTVVEMPLMELIVKYALMAIMVTRGWRPTFLVENVLVRILKPVDIPSLKGNY